MEFKKAWVWVLTFILITSFMVTGQVKAETGDVKIVVLVSDNEADSTVAASIAELLNFTVVTTQWGIYNPNVTAEIIEDMPDKVIIIGGPVAVPMEYEQDLNNLGIPYERWYGADRYSTNVRVIEKAREEFPGIFKDVEVFIVNGRDVGAIQMVRKYELKKKVIPLFVDNGLENQTKIIGSLIKPKQVVLVRSPLLSESLFVTIEGIIERSGVQLSEESLDATERLAWNSIISTGGLLELARTTLDDLKIPGAKNMLELASRELEKARQEYARGNYEAAYRYSIYARTHADVVIVLAGKEKNKILHGLPKVALEHDILRLEIQIQALANSGVDVTEIQSLLNQAKAALQSGDIDSAFEITQVIKEKLRTLFVNGKGKSRHKPVHHRGRP